MNEVNNNQGLETHDFEVPFGHVDKNGVLHTTITMRPVLGEDLMKVARDAEVMGLKREQHKVSLAVVKHSEAARAAEQGKAIYMSGGSDDVEVDPIGSKMTEAAMLRMNAVLFSRVVLSVGTVQKPDRTVFHKMNPADIEMIQAMYEWINTPPKQREVKPGEDKKPEDPSSGSPE